MRIIKKILAVFLISIITGSTYYARPAISKEKIPADIKELIDKLGSSDQKEQYEAIRDLSEMEERAAPASLCL
jgi:hypothetical protein